LCSIEVPDAAAGISVSSAAQTVHTSAFSLLSSCSSSLSRSRFRVQCSTFASGVPVAGIVVD
jgi:hypothetical protein